MKKRQRRKGKEKEKEGNNDEIEEEGKEKQRITCTCDKSLNKSTNDRKSNTIFNFRRLLLNESTKVISCMKL